MSDQKYSCTFNFGRTRDLKKVSFGRYWKQKYHCWKKFGCFVVVLTTNGFISFQHLRTSTFFKALVLHKPNVQLDFLELNKHSFDSYFHPLRFNLVLWPPFWIGISTKYIQYIVCLIFYGLQNEVSQLYIYILYKLIF